MDASRLVVKQSGVSHGWNEQVNFMLSGNDVEVDDGDYHQRTALHLAASSGHIAMVRHLVLIHGANMNVLDRSAPDLPSYLDILHALLHAAWGVDHLYHWVLGVVCTAGAALLQPAV